MLEPSCEAMAYVANTRTRTWKDIEPGCTPKLESCKCSQNAMGFEESAIMRESLGRRTASCTES